MKIYKIKKKNKKKLALICFSIVIGSIVISTSVGISSSLKDKVIQPSQLDEQIKNIASKIKPNKSILFSFQQSDQVTQNQDKNLKKAVVSTALQFVSLNDFLNNVNRQITSNETKKYLENFLNFNEILFELNTKIGPKVAENCDFKLVRNPNNQNQWITNTNNNLYFFIQNQSKSTDGKGGESEIIAVPLNIVGLFGKTNFDNSFSFSNLKENDFFKQGFKDSLPQQKLNINSIRRLWWQQWEKRSTSNSLKNSKLDLSLISAFDFLHIFKSTFFVSKKDKDDYLLSIISNSLKKPLIKQLNFINANLNDITKENLDKFFEINFKLDSDTLRIYFDANENKPYLKVDGLVEIKTKFIDVSTIKKIEIKINNMNFSKSSQDSESTEPNGIYYWLSSKYRYDSDKIEPFESTSSNSIGINNLKNLIEKQRYNQVIDMLKKPDIYGLRLNDEQKLQAISRDFRNIPIETFLANSRINQKDSEENKVINIETKLFKNNLDVPRFLFNLANQGIYNVAIYFLSILKEAGLISKDTTFFNNESKKIFEELSKISFIDPKKADSTSKSEFNLFSFNNDYLDTTFNLNKNNLNDGIFYLSTLYIPFDLAAIKNDFATKESNEILYKIATFEANNENADNKSDFYYNLQPYYKKDKSKQIPIQNLADLLLAFYAKLRFLANSNFGFPLLKLGNHLGYQIIFKSSAIDSGQVKTTENELESKKPEIYYQYHFGFLKNGKISYELFKTAFRPLNNIKFYDDQIKDISDEKQQNILNLNKIALETPSAFQRISVTNSDFNHLDDLVTKLSMQQLLKRIGLSNLLDYYKTIDPTISLTSNPLSQDDLDLSDDTNHSSKLSQKNTKFLQLWLERGEDISSVPLVIYVYNLGLN